MADLRSTIARARKFVLTEEMSAFVGDIGQVPFMKDRGRNDQVLDTIRHGAILPHETVWIELDGRALKKRVMDLYEAAGSDPLKDPWGDPMERVALVDDVDTCVSTWGWLLEQDPRDPRIATMRSFMGGGFDGGSGDPNSDPVTVPFSVSWTASDDYLCHTEDEAARVMIAHGIRGYYCPSFRLNVDPVASCNFKFSNMYREHDGHHHGKIPVSVGETAGAVRYAMALLSTLNDIPVLRTDVRPSKGYVSRGSYRRFVDHTVIKLNVPQKVSRQRLALKLIAASRRRMHEVRGHWRLYQRGAGVLCLPSLHQWAEPVPNADGKLHAACGSCSAWRTWIPKHDRGNALLGVVTHEYAVAHDK